MLATAGWRSWSSPSTALAALLLVLSASCASEVFTPLEACRYRVGHEGDFRPLRSTAEIPDDVHDDGVYEVACDLPALEPDHPAAWVQRSRSLRAASVDGRSIPVDRWPAELVSLEASDSGRTLVLALDARDAHVIGSVVVGSERALVHSAIAPELPIFAGFVVMACAAVVLASTALWRRRSELAWAALFWLSIAAIQLAGAPTLATALHPDTRLHGWLLYTNLFLFPLGLARFMSTFVDARSARRSRLVSLALPFMLLVAVVLHVSRVAPISTTYRLSYVITFALIAIALPAVVRAARSRAGAARLMLLGCAAMFVLAVPDMLAGADVVELLPFPVSQYGLWAFGIAMAFALERWEHQGRDEVERTERELATRVRELEHRRAENERLDEDLRLQIARRSRELRELLAPGPAPRSDVRSAVPESGLVDERYRVVRALGAGAMGAVYEVERTRDSRRLALKVMRGAVTPEHVARFMREAEIAAQIRHPNLVGIVDVGVTPGNLPYLVMELVEGRDLQQARDRFGDALWARVVLRELAAGLAALHERGIVHRDIKPANVLLARNADGTETVKIADFGIARQDERAALGSAADLAGADTMAARPALTEMGALIGTPLYMAPETARGPATAAADVFALGVVAHELFLGTRPFETPPVVIAWAGEQLPKISLAAVSGVEPTILRIVELALSAAPSERPTAAQIAAACA